jgi:hypothetical protein
MITHHYSTHHNTKARPYHIKSTAGEQHITKLPNRASRDGDREVRMCGEGEEGVQVQVGRCMHAPEPSMLEITIISKQKSKKQNKIKQVQCTNQCV